MRLDESNKISHNYIFSYTLAAIYKMIWTINSIHNHDTVSILKQKKYESFFNKKKWGGVVYLFNK